MLRQPSQSSTTSRGRRRDLRVDQRHQRHPPIVVVLIVLVVVGRGREAGDEQAQALVDLRRGQPDALVLPHRLEHVVDELLDARASGSRPGRLPGRARAGPDGPCARPSESPWPHYSRRRDAASGVPLLSRLRRPAGDAPAEGRPTRSAWSAHRAGSCSTWIRRSRSGTIIRTDDERLVLVRRAIEPGYGLWVFPGRLRRSRRGDHRRRAPGGEGGVRPRRPARRPDQHLLVPRPARRSSSSMRRRCSAASCAATTNAWRPASSPPDAIPWDALAFRSTDEALRDYFRNATARTEHRMLERTDGFRARRGIIRLSPAKSGPPGPIAVTTPSRAPPCAYPILNRPTMMKNLALAAACR